MAKGWVNDFERHSLARQGIKTAVPKAKKSYFIPEPFGLPRELQPTNKYFTDEEKKAMRKKWRDENNKKQKGHWIVQGNYGSRWEDVTEEENKFDGLNMLKDYNDNEKQYPHRLIKRRK